MSSKWLSLRTCDEPALLHDLPGEDLVECEQVLSLLLLLAQVVLVGVRVGPAASRRVRRLN